MKLGLSLALTLTLLVPAPGSAQPGPSPKLPATFTVAARSGHATATLYAVVAPIRRITVRAAATGVLTSSRCRPGDPVRRGEVVARLAGSEYEAAVASARSALAAARKLRASAADELKETKARLPLLGTHADLDRARAALASAQAGVAERQARLATLEAAGKISAPANGTVSAVRRGNGERVAPGDSILVIEPHSGLWLRARAYGESAARVAIGMQGTFHSTASGKPIEVRVASLIPGGARDGLGVALTATQGHPGWFSGVSGTVELDGRPVIEPAVPDRCLVLDDGKWWVVEVVAGKLERHRVHPDFSRDGWTWIASGLAPGARIVINDAYLLYHRDLAQRFASED